MFETYPRCLPMPTTGVKYLVAMLTFPGMYAAAGVYFASELEGQKDEAPKPSGKNDATRLVCGFIKMDLFYLHLIFLYFFCF